MLQGAVLRGGHCTHLTGHPGPNQICDFVHEIERGAMQVLMDQSRGERVTGTYRICHLHFESGMLARAFLAYKETSPPSSRDGAQLPLLLFDQEASGCHLF